MKHGLSCYCVKCKSKIAKDYDKKNQPQIIEYRKKYYLENREKLISRTKEYEANNKEKVFVSHKKYRAKNIDRITEEKKVYYQENKGRISRDTKAYRSKNKTKIAKYHKKYREENIVEIAKYHKEYKKKYTIRNKERIREQSRQYSKKKRKNMTAEEIALANKKSSTYQATRKKTDPNFKLIVLLRNRILCALKNNKTAKRTKSTILLGCTIQEYRDHLEGQFKPGMTWENHGRTGWHIDHIMPCASFDLTDVEQQKKCFNYKNTQPLWARDNLIKSSKYQPPQGELS